MNWRSLFVGNNFLINNTYNIERDYEVIERKGKGHPDTMSDALAERLSNVYSKYCLDNFDVILHHNFDKVGMMGGISEVGFCIGKIASPIRVLINGRASDQFGDQVIPLREMLEAETIKFFKEYFPHINDIKSILRIMWEVASGSSPGAVVDTKSYRHYWFKPRNKDDLSETKSLNCNDTSMGQAYYGNTKLERLVLDVEDTLNSDECKKKFPWIGSDIKIMCFRLGKSVSFTLCIPQISVFVKDVADYMNNLDLARAIILETANKVCPDYDVAININMRDKITPENVDLYLTYTGSSIEMGDEGFVGRGNRIGGLITPNRSYSMEGICGKNPVYHTGKIYSAFAYEICKEIYEKFSIMCEAILIGQTGQSLVDPHKIIINCCGGMLTEYDLLPLIKKAINPVVTTSKIINAEYKFY